MTSAFVQDCGRSSDIISSNVLIYPGGIQVGAVRSPGGKISHPTLVTKTTGSTLAAADLVNSLIVVSNNAAGLTLNIPNVEDILTAFAAYGQIFSVGDQFEVNIARFFDLVNVGTLTLAALPAAVGQHAVTFATGSAPTSLTASAGAATHVTKLRFLITSLTTPAITIFSIVG